MAAAWYGSDGQGWTFSKRNYEDYVDENELYEIIQKYDKGKMFREFTELEILKLAFFVLNNGMNEMDHVSESEAMDLVKEWKNQLNGGELSGYFCSRKR